MARGYQTAIIYVLSFIVLLLAMPRDLYVFDEGIILLDAMRVLNGEIIHRDFYANYGPGQYYALAALFATFGKSFMVERLFDIAERAAGLATLFYVVRQVSPFKFSLAVTALGGMWMIFTLMSPLYPVFPCIPLSIIGAYLLTRAARLAFPIWRVGLAGATAGAAALFRYDVGFLVFVAHILSLTFLVYLNEPPGRRTRRWLRAVVAYGAGTALAFAPAAILLLVTGAIPGFIGDIIDFSARYYRRMRNLPFPGFEVYPNDIVRWGVYFPILAVALSALPLLSSLRSLRWRRPEERASIDYYAAFGILSGLLFFKGVVRAVPLHMTLAIIPSLIVFALVLKGWWRQGVALRIAAFALGLVIFLPSANGMKQEIGHSYRVGDRSIAQWLAIRAGLISARAAPACVEAPNTGIAQISPDYVRIANFIDAFSRPDERILVAVDHHDRLGWNAASLYFIARRLPETRWAQFDPGLQTRADIQSAMIDELDHGSVRWVVQDGEIAPPDEPNESSLSSGVTLLDDYLKKNYHPVAYAGKVSLLLKNGETLQRIAPGSPDCEAELVK
ncbi:MAG TPA: hypothetical protein VKZ79_01195 [Alphaproteobacteria bacterium]|nr:hypothetical protein [Alphaproteobacteria bacterium]